jgi:flagellar motor switch protein FliG
MAAFQIIDDATQQKVIEEFSEVVVAGMQSALGGASYAQLTLEKAKGDYTASEILDRIAPAGRPAAQGGDIRRMDAQQIANLVKFEQPQTVAFVLSCVEAPTAARVVMLLPQELREEVVERLATMGETSRDMAGKVAKHLNSRLDPQSLQQAMHRGDGVQSAADILNALDRETRKSMLLRIEERNAALGSAIRKKVFGFDDILRLETADLQRVLREVDMRDLALALKNAKPPQLAAVAAAMSKRAGQGLREEIDMLPPQKPKLIDEAQAKIIQIVLKLEESEEITLDFGGEAHAVA